MTASVVQLERSPPNPILEPRAGTTWESRAVFNPAAAVIDGTVHPLYRAMGTSGQFLSRLGLATSEGVDERGVYRAEAALLELEHPDRVRARLPYPILEPEEPYEKEGVRPDVVFPEGTATVDGWLLVCYGAADTVCGMAGIELAALLDALEAHPAAQPPHDRHDP